MARGSDRARGRRTATSTQGAAFLVATTVLSSAVACAVVRWLSSAT